MSSETPVVIPKNIHDFISALAHFYGDNEDFDFHSVFRNLIHREPEIPEATLFLDPDIPRGKEILQKLSEDLVIEEDVRSHILILIQKKCTVNNFSKWFRHTVGKETNVEQATFFIVEKLQKDEKENLSVEGRSIPLMSSGTTSSSSSSFSGSFSSSLSSSSSPSSSSSSASSSPYSACEVKEEKEKKKEKKEKESCPKKKR